MTTELKQKAIILRNNGKTYSEIIKSLNVSIPKSTLSYWFKNIIMSSEYKEKIKKQRNDNLNKAREKALIVNKNKRKEYFKKIENKNQKLIPLLKNNDVAKIALSMLYVGEGSKSTKSALMFGNSSTSIIKIFLKLLRNCYTIDETKFRCTVQCRADQKTKELEQYWSEITKIPLIQFYKTQIDPRTIDKPSKKVEYKGVCRINYFSADICNEINTINKIIDNQY